MKIIKKALALTVIVASLCSCELSEARAYSSDEEYMLAKIAMAEAEGESLEEKALVIRVVLNRVESKEWPNTIHDVLYQKDQFTPVTVDGRYFRVEPNSDCYKALEMVLGGWDKSQGAMYFCEGYSKWHENHLTYLFQVGKTKFYK